MATPKAARGTECSDETGLIAAPGNGAVIAIAAGEPLSRVPPARRTKALARGIEAARPSCAARSTRAR